MNAKNACAVMLGSIFLVIFIALVVPHAQSPGLRSFRCLPA